MVRNKLFILASVVLLLGTGVGHASSITVQLFEDGLNPYGGSNTQTLSSATGTYIFSFPDLPSLDFTGISGRVTTNDNLGSTTSGFTTLRFSSTHNGAVTHTLEIISTDSNFVGVATPYMSTVSVSGSGTSGSGGAITVSGKVIGTFTGATSSTGTLTGAAAGAGTASYTQPAVATVPPTFTGSNPYTLKDDSSLTATADGDLDVVSGTLLAQAIPEPASFALVISGLVFTGFAGFWRKLRR